MRLRLALLALTIALPARAAALGAVLMSKPVKPAILKAFLSSNREK